MPIQSRATSLQLPLNPTPGAGSLAPLVQPAEPRRDPTAVRRASSVLQGAARFWFLVAIAGQMMFAYYIAMLYGGAAISGNVSDFNRVMPKGHIAGDAIGNAVVAMHVALAAIIIIGGAVQLLPPIRRHVPALHRWTGRLYIMSAFALSLGGLYMVWVRGSIGDMSQHVSISLNALLIMGFAAMAWRHARARRVALHRRWALRLFLAVSGVWFFRVGLMLWLLIHRAPVGFDPKTFTGPFITVLAFSQYLIPLLVLELYLRAQERAGVAARVSMAAALLVLTVAMGAGIFGATMGMWLPRV